MSEEIPQTKQGLLIYIEYAKKEIKRCELTKKLMEKRIKECQQRLDVYEES